MVSPEKYLAGLLEPEPEPGRSPAKQALNVHADIVKFYGLSGLLLMFR